jgi:hypothetical protein
VAIPAPVTKVAKPAAKATAKPAATAKTAPKAAASAQPRKAAATPTAESAADLLASVKAASLAMTSFEADLLSEEQRFDKSVSTTSHLALLYKQPGQYRFACTKSTKADNTGVRMVYRMGDKEVQVRPSGLLSLLAVKLPLTDTRIVTLNGYSLDQITMEGLLNRLASGSYHAERAGTVSVGGETLTLLKLTGDSRAFDPHIAYEVIGFDAARHYRYWEAHAKPELGVPGDSLHRLTITRVVPNAPLAADAFSI